MYRQRGLHIVLQMTGVSSELDAITVQKKQFTFFTNNSPFSQFVFLMCKIIFQCKYFKDEICLGEIICFFFVNNKKEKAWGDLI